MKKNSSIQIKSAFLLIVFSMNMVISFACTVGLEICCCGSDHEENELMAHENPGHAHDEAVKDHKSKEGCDDDCCNDNLIRFSQVDKSCPQFIAGFNGKLFISFIYSFYRIHIVSTSKGYANTWRNVQNHHPPIPDIRVAIQSFQI